IDYNFIVDVISEWVCETAIYDDFRLNETQNESSFRNAIFLVVGILEQYYRVVYMNNSAINLSRYKSKQSINITQRFYNMMIMKNGNSYRQYSAVGFSASSIKSLVPAAKYAELMKASTNSSFEMAAFGVVNCRRLMNEITEDIPHVTS
ncbi:hypothetical protein, partial [Sulfuricurvum sp.]|uniref:hypothetical protein n=1 Tax=Sulfuricurvum sp. TaxID=2025608 RepID=UPI00260D1E57